MNPVIAQLRPDVVRLVEETVTNLKALENQIEIVKTDLASLCLQIGHPEAARIAATPIRGLLSSTGALATPFGLSPFATASPFAAPTALPNVGLATTPYLSSGAIVGAASPWVLSPYGTIAPSSFGPAYASPLGAQLGFAPAFLPFR